MQAIQRMIRVVIGTLAFTLPAVGGPKRASADESRTWTDASGTFKRQATFLFLEGDMVFLKLSDGSERRIPVAKLSKADQDYVATAQARADSLDPFEVVPPSPPGGDTRSPSRPASPADTTAEAPVRVVVVQGVGMDAASAKNDAYREAVRQVVGAFVDSSTLAANDQLLEDRIITLSSAFVEKSEPIKEASDGGLVRVRLRAHVRVNQVLESLRAENIAILRVDAESLAAQQASKADQSEGMQELVTRLLPGMHKTCLTASAEGKPEIRAATADEADVTFRLRVSPQLEAYVAFSRKLDAALSATERPSGELVSDGTKLSNGDDFREHISSFKRDQAEYFLPKLFTSAADEKIIEKSLDDAGVSEIMTYDPVFVFSEATASRREWGYGLDLLSTVSWPKLTKAKGDLIVLLMVHSNATYSRTRWKWFRLTASEADMFINSLKGTMNAVAVLKDRSGEEIARDRVGFANVGVTTLNGPAVALSPFFMLGDDLQHYLPSLSTQRSVRLTKAEVSSVHTIETFIQDGEPLMIYGR